MRFILIVIPFFVTAVSVFGETRDYKKTEDVINRILDRTDAVQEKSQTEGVQQKDLSEQVNGDSDDSAEESKPEQSAPKSARGRSGPSAAETALLKSGIEFYESGLFDNSLKAFDELLTNYPLSSYADSARIWRGKIHIRKHSYDRALSEFALIPDNSGEYPASLFNTAEAFAFQKNIPEAISSYQKVALLFPTHELADRALLEAANLYLNSGMGEKSVETLAKIIKHYPSRHTIDDAYYHLARVYERDPSMRDIETARALYAVFLKKAKNGDKFFSNSPLIDKVTNDLGRINKIYFKFEN